MDVVFFLKAVPTGNDRAVAWPRPTKLIAIDPGVYRCGGTDPLCSSAYTRLWSALRDPATGRVLPNLLRKYASGIDVERIAFMGFSAAHGLLDPLAENAEDRARISAYLLLDATFGGSKDGYKAFAREAAAGDRLLFTATSNTGGDESWRLVWDSALQGRRPARVRAAPPLPEPSGGAWRVGDLYYYRYVDAAGGSELPHWRMGEIQNAVLSGMLAPYWRGSWETWAWGAAGAAAFLGGWWGYRRLRRRQAS